MDYVLRAFWDSQQIALSVLLIVLYLLTAVVALATTSWLVGRLTGGERRRR